MSADDTVVCFTNLCTSEIAGVVKDDLYNGWKVAGLSLIRVKQNQCFLEVGRILPNHQILDKFSYLGVLDENLSWKDHVEYVSSKVSRRLGILSRIRSCLTLEASKQVSTSFVQPLLDYADVAWEKISEGCCKELQRLQNRAARIILWKNTSNDTFCVLNWLNLSGPL